MIEQGIDVLKADVELLAELQDKSCDGLDSWIVTADHLGISGFADTVMLRAENESVQVIGDLIDFDRVIYTLETSIGAIRLAASGLICEGDACPFHCTRAGFHDFGRFGFD